MSGENLRLFLAAPLHQMFGQEITEILTALKTKIPGVSWTVPEQVHVTLHFFGDVPSSEVDRIGHAMQGILPRFGSMSVCLDGIGGFPDLRRPHVIWLGVQEEAGAFVDLQTAVTHEVKALGFEIESRPFKPHATIGRVKRIPGGVSLQDEIQKIRFPLPTALRSLDHFVLYQSCLLPGGARYEVLKKFPLSKAS